MKLICREKCRYLSKAVLMFAVLSALLFSCGEGVRLIPFPELETTEFDACHLYSNNKIPYQFSIHRLKNSSATLKPKNQQSGLYDNLQGNLNSFDFSLPLYYSSHLRRIFFLRKTDLFQSGLFPSDRESRAPPLV